LITEVETIIQEKLHAVYPKLYKPTLLNGKKINLINYKHAIYALAHFNQSTARLECIS